MFSLSFHLYGVFFLLLTLNSLTQSKIILPFKLFFPNSTYANYLDKYYINYLGTEISIGTPPQKFILNLNSSTNTFWVLSHRAELPFPSYDLTKSSSVKDGNSFITKVKDVILDEGQHIKDINIVASWRVPYIRSIVAAGLERLCWARALTYNDLHFSL